MADGKLVILTAASENHARPLFNLLASIDHHEPGTEIIIYDLGLSKATLRKLRKQRRNVSPFPFSDYPPHVAPDRLRTYAWKPIMIYKTLQREGAPLLYLDAGDLLHAPLRRIRAELERIGFYCPLSTGTIGRWCHPATLEAMRVEPGIPDDLMRNAAIIGFGDSALARELAAQWYECALRPEIICPPGATVQGGHRFDQAVLSILLARARRRDGFAPEDEPLDISCHNDRLLQREARYFMTRAAPRRGRARASRNRVKRRMRLRNRVWRGLKRGWRRMVAMVDG
ncbi:MAG: DUF1647 domain-containing protein [Dongiaceae bacterium]